MLFPWTRNFTPKDLSPPRRINGYQPYSNTAQDKPEKDYHLIHVGVEMLLLHATETGRSSYGMDLAFYL